MNQKAVREMLRTALSYTEASMKILRHAPYPPLSPRRARVVRAFRMYGIMLLTVAICTAVGALPRVSRTLSLLIRDGPSIETFGIVSVVMFPLGFGVCGFMAIMAARGVGCRRRWAGQMIMSVCPYPPFLALLHLAGSRDSLLVGVLGFSFFLISAAYLIYVFWRMEKYEPPAAR